MLMKLITGGILCEKIGSKWIIGLMTFCAGVLTIFNPLVAQYGGVTAISIIRAIQGFVQVN